ncbi:MAG TPA: DUF11 domain-containing protein [Xanthomonadales bacterium]|nr:DUF11 domain-containing protein [Xanthomonadales bacterium]
MTQDFKFLTVLRSLTAILFAVTLAIAQPVYGEQSSMPEEKEGVAQRSDAGLSVGQTPPSGPIVRALGPGLSTLGLDFQMSQFGVDTTFSPPDTMGDIGPDHIVEMINGRYEVYDKQDGTVLDSRSLNSFWTNIVGLNLPQNICQADNTCSIDGAACMVNSDCASNFTFDPRIVYDRLSQRWVAISIDAALGADNDFYLARSDTSDPTGNWEGLKFDSDTTGPAEFHDYETLAVDMDAVTTCTQDFDSGNGGGGVESCYTIPKADILAPVPTVANMTRFESNPPNLPSVSGSIQPALSFEAVADGTTPIFGVSGGAIVRGDITGAGAAGAVLGPTGGIVGDPGHANPPAARQPAADPGATIENVAPRFVSNVIEIGDSIWAVHSVAGSGSNAALQWYEIEESTDNLLQWGLIEDTNEDYHEPSIAVNSMGDVLIGYSCSGPSLNVSTCISVGETIAGVTTFEPRQIVTAGAGLYYQLIRGRNRWGDYSATVVDPDDECTFWTMQEFVAVGGPANVGPGGMGTDDDVEGGAYGTQVTEVVINGCAEADIRIIKADSPDPVVAGTNLSYTLDVSNLGPSRAFSVLASDFLPSDVSYVSSIDGDWSCAHAAGTVDCTWNGGNPSGSLASGEDADTVNLTVAVNPSMVFEGRFSLSNTAGASSDTPDPDVLNNEDTEDTSVVAETDLDIERFEAINPPDEILVGEDIAITLEKDVSNHGPSWPVNTEVSVDATPPADSTIDPAMASQNVLIPELDTVVTVEENFTINCGAASNHLWSFENTIVPTDAMTTDPDLSNNTANLDVQIECIVPVAINFKPGSDPNSEQRLKGIAPVAVLTTMAGEYDTPLDFDATLIDPLSVRFGPPAIFGDDGLGAFEVHNRGHLEDSIELDEVTMDGDTDMLLHFKMKDAGFDGTETEACVKGEYTDDTGTHQFFGCDAIRFPPGSD